MSTKRTPSLRQYLTLLSNLKIESLQAARRFYIDYHALLCASGSYSSWKIAASVARSVTSLAVPHRDVNGKTAVICDGDGASGARTLHELGLSSPLNLRPSHCLRHLRRSVRPCIAAGLVGAAGDPSRFFARLFDAYTLVAREVLGGHSSCGTVIAANERSIGCAPFLAAAKFELGRKIVVVQHGNPIADYLPTLADEYWCRSDRWYEYLVAQALVSLPRRIADFPPLKLFEYNPASRSVVLVLHNVGYLEPPLDYGQITRQVAAEVARAGYTLVVLPHPSSKETFGLPTVARASPAAAALALGYRSTVMDQLPSGLPRISLIDYWPEFFLTEGRPALLDDFLMRIREALT